MRTRDVRIGMEVWVTCGGERHRYQVHRRWGAQWFLTGAEHTYTTVHARYMEPVYCGKRIPGSGGGTCGLKHGHKETWHTVLRETGGPT